MSDIDHCSDYIPPAVAKETDPEAYKFSGKPVIIMVNLDEMVRANAIELVGTKGLALERMRRKGRSN